jgi:hypothetical protein
MKSEVKALFAETVSRSNQRNGSGGERGGLNKPAARWTRKFGRSLWSTQSGELIPQLPEKMNKLDPQEAEERRKEPQLGHRDEERNRTAPWKRVDEHAISDDDDQEGYKRVENCIACAAEIATLNSPNEGESSPDKESLRKEKQRQNKQRDQQENDMKFGTGSQKGAPQNICSDELAKRRVAQLL